MVDTIKFSEFVNGGDLENDETTVGLDGGVNTRFNNPWTFLKPGTTGDRPVPAASMYYRLRFNTTLEVYEYYDPTTVTWTQLSGTGTGTVNPGVANDIAFYAANGQAVSPIASLANAVLSSNGSGVPSMSTTLPSGLSIPGAIITASTAALTSGSVVAAPVAGTDLVNKTYADALFGAGVASATGTTNQVLVNGAAGVPTSGAITLSLPQDIAVGSTPTFAGMTLSSIPLGFSSGGTNRNSLPLIPAASSYAAWDANLNFFANNLIPSLSSVATSGGTTILTVASAGTLELTGALTQTVQMPVTSTLAAGFPYKIINNSSGNVTLTSSGGNTILVMAANTTAFLTCVSTSGTTAASWNASYIFDNGAGVLSITGTANQVIASASTGAITLSLPQSIDTAAAVTFGSVAFSNSAQGIVGVTSASNAAAGYVGEVITNAAVGVAISTLTATNITSIPLTAGEWLVFGNVTMTTSGGGLQATSWGWSSTTSATLPSTLFTNGQVVNTADISTFGRSIITTRYKFTANTTVYLSAYAIFASGTTAGAGSITGLRIR